MLREREKEQRGGRMGAVSQFRSVRGPCARATPPVGAPALGGVNKKKIWTHQQIEHTTERSHTTMPPYDSESSDEGEDFAETNVLLGYATREATGDAISHLGGAPVSPARGLRRHTCTC